MHFSLSRRAREVANDVFKPILVTSLEFSDVTKLNCDLPSNVVFIDACPFNSL